MLKEYKALLYEKDGNLVILTLNVPDRLNALNDDMRRSMALACEEISSDDDVRVAILTGAGKGFCSGADVTGQAARIAGQVTEVPRRQRIHVGGDMGILFPKMDKPVIAAINGACVGAGMSMALACDIRFASTAAKFGSVFINRGLVPDNGLSYLLPNLIGISRALELMFTGRVFGADKALELGIVDHVVPPEELMPAAKALAAEIAAKPPVAVELTKKAVYRFRVEEIVRQLYVDYWAQPICRSTEDHKEAVKSFLEKRPPKFTGK